MQTSNSGRVVYLLAISEGLVKYALPEDTAWTTPTNETGEDPPLIYSGTVYSTSCNQLQFFADGTNYVYFNPALDKVLSWVASSGTLPVDEEGNTPRLICTWRGRVVQSGILLEPQNIFWSAVGDPFDWEYSGQYADETATQLSTTPTQAVAANLAPFGLIGDVVTSLCPYTDDILIIFCDSHIYMLRGDPADGGHVDLISDTIGGAWGICWCKDPYGVVYFFSNKMGIYKLVPGQTPQRISQPIEALVVDVNTGENALLLAWNDRYQGLDLFITPLDAPHDDTVHLIYETRTGSWFTMGFKNKNHNPLCCCTLDGNRPDDRVVAIGGWDGIVRVIDPTATRDDGYDIESEVVIGPFVTDNLDELKLIDMQAVLAMDSDPVTFEVFVGETAEEALRSDPVLTGTGEDGWTEGRNYNTHVNLAGYCIYLKISSNKAWAMESVRLRLAAQGKIRQRGRE